MKIYAEEDVINKLLDKLDKNFELHENMYVMTITGKQILEDQPGLKPFLKSSLNDLRNIFHLDINEKYEKINPKAFYILLYGNEDNDKNKQVYLLFPYGINLAPILSGAIIRDRKNNLATQAQADQLLNQINNETIDDIVTHQLFKLYQPNLDQKTPVNQDVVDKIRYKGLKNDSFNLVINFVLPLKDLYEPLKKVITDQKKDIDYNDYSIVPLQAVSYDKKNNQVNLVTSLY